MDIHNWYQFGWVLVAEEASGSHVCYNTECKYVKKKTIYLSIYPSIYIHLSI